MRACCACVHLMCIILTSMCDFFRYTFIIIPEEDERKKLWERDAARELPIKCNKNCLNIVRDTFEGKNQSLNCFLFAACFFCVQTAIPFRSCFFPFLLPSRSLSYPACSQIEFTKVTSVAMSSRHKN